MLLITLDASKVEARLDDMIEKLGHFTSDMADELTEWQTEDMHRHYPNTKQDDTSVETEIWPTSRRVETNKTKIRATLARAKRGTVVKKPLNPGQKGTSTRPILRPELYDKLADRMDALMGEKITWR
jgi:hypothetical protein